MNDYIMAAFQTGACFFLSLSIAAVYRDRVLKGVSIWMIAFFTAWTIFGTWNWYHLNQFWCYVSGILMSIVYLIWLALAIAATYEQREKQRAKNKADWMSFS